MQELEVAWPFVEAVAADDEKGFATRFRQGDVGKCRAGLSNPTRRDQ